MMSLYLWLVIVVRRVGLGISLGLEVVHLGIIGLDHRSTLCILKVTAVRVV
jgi:hypothetical protein